MVIFSKVSEGYEILDPLRMTFMDLRGLAAFNFEV